MQLNIKKATTVVGSPPLMPLPNLFLTSAGTLLCLYLLLGFILIAAVEYKDLPVELAVGIGIVVMFVQFLFGPKMMDFSLFMFFKMKWVSKEELPDHLVMFVDEVCKTRSIPFPRFAIIDDGAPQAFTYGHTPRNARIVISRGILELLSPKEVEAVVAHEIGHAVHWDMFLMTVAQLVPLIMYYIYKTMINARGENNKGGYAQTIAVAAYVLYWISSYVVLAFSRVREYYADRFSGRTTGNPANLASALVKIAYGLAGTEKQPSQSSNRNSGMAAVAAMGIFDENTALSLAITSNATQAETGSIENIEAAMCWDLWNPWARWYELSSTHPLIAKRLIHLGNQSLHMGRRPYITFKQAQSESYWDEFVIDLVIYLLPFLLPLTFYLLYWFAPHYPLHTYFQPAIMVSLGLGLLIRYYFSYSQRGSSEVNVAQLLGHVKVSEIRPVPCVLKGRIIGRGVPGLLISEDFVMQDDTGIIFLDMRHPFRILDLLFGIIKGGAFQGKEIVATGWYRRSPVPYVELLNISYSGHTTKSWVPAMKQAGAYILVCIGLLWGLAL